VGARSVCLDLRGVDPDGAAVSKKEIDHCLGNLDEPKRAALVQLGIAMEREQLLNLKRLVEATA
jgi:hypothetical protein